jgi:hypothetical protein
VVCFDKVFEVYHSEWFMGVVSKGRRPGVLKQGSGASMLQVAMLW